MQTEKNIQMSSESLQDTIREPEKQFGPRGTLIIPVSDPEESGVYERRSMPEVHVPPKPQEVVMEPQVIINAEKTKLEQLRGGMVEVAPLQDQRFDLEEVETNLGRVQMAIIQAQELVGKAQTPEERGLAMKKLTELGREKAALDAQLPFARKDELKNIESEFEIMATNYHRLLQKPDKTPQEIEELARLAERLPTAKAHRDQLKQSMAFRKEKGMSTSDEKQSIGSKIAGWFKSLLGK